MCGTAKEQKSHLWIDCCFESVEKFKYIRTIINDKNKRATVCLTQRREENLRLFEKNIVEITVGPKNGTMRIYTPDEPRDKVNHKR